MIRPPLPSDQGYIAATWARSMVGHAHHKHFRRPGMLSGVEQPTPGEIANAQINAVMDRPDTRGLLFVRDDDPRYIMSWIVYVEGPTTPVLHYCYTRNFDDAGRPLRGAGYAGQLLSAIGVARDRGVVCTSVGPSSESMRLRYRASVHVPLAEFLK